MSKFSEAIDCNEISDSIPSKIGRKRLMDVLLKEETETNLQRPYETILRKIDLNLIFNVEFGGKYEKRNYNGFADFLEEQSAKNGRRKSVRRYNRTEKNGRPVIITF